MNDINIYACDSAWRFFHIKTVLGKQNNINLLQWWERAARVGEQEFPKLILLQDKKINYSERTDFQCSFSCFHLAEDSDIWFFIKLCIILSLCVFSQDPFAKAAYTAQSVFEFKCSPDTYSVVVRSSPRLPILWAAPWSQGFLTGFGLHAMRWAVKHPLILSGILVCLMREAYS